VTILYDEPRMLIVPVDHRLAGKESVTLDDIADEPVPRFPDSTWSAYWRIDPRPDGTPAPDGPLVETIEDKNELVAAGQAVAIVPGGLYDGNVRSDLVTIPLRGVEPGHVVLATRAGDGGRLVTAFRKSAQELLTRPGTPALCRSRGLIWTVSGLLVHAIQADECHVVFAAQTGSETRS
jgi:DNA-binding transcriptional LysR family regulator